MTNAQGASQADLTTDPHPQPLTEFQRDALELGPDTATELALENPRGNPYWGPETPTPQATIARRGSLADIYRQAPQFQRDTLELGGPIAAVEIALENPADHSWLSPSTPQTTIAHRVDEAQWRARLRQTELEAG